MGFRLERSFSPEWQMRHSAVGGRSLRCGFLLSEMGRVCLAVFFFFFSFPLPRVKLSFFIIIQLNTIQIECSLSLNERIPVPQI